MLDIPSSVCVLTKDVETALKKGPLIVTEVVPVPPPQCNCGGDEFDEPHGEKCPKSSGPGGFAGHPQWVYVADRDGNILQSRTTPGEPSRFSGAWFVRFEPVAVTQ